MAGELQTDNQGNFRYKSKSGEFVPSRVQHNPETGEYRAETADGWKDVTDLMPKASDPAMERRAAGLDPTDLSIARSKNDEFGKFLREKAKMRREGEGEWERGRRLYGGIGIPSQGEAATRSYVQGGALGFGDELVAGAASLLGDKSYQDNLASERWRLKTGQKEYPATTTAAEIGGAITSPATLLSGGLASAPTTTGGKIVAGGLLGGTEAGVYGLGQGEGAVKDQISSGVQAAPFGLLAGAGAPVLGKFAGDAYQAIKNKLLASSLGAQRAPAAAIVRDVMSADETLAGAGEARLRGIGPDAMLAEAGPASQALLDTAIQMSGQGGRKAIEAVDQRVAKASSDLTSALNKYLGNVEGIISRARFNSKSTQKARGNAYGQAYSTPIDYAAQSGRSIESVLSRIPDRVKADAIRIANEDMVAAGQRNMQILFDVAPDGSVTFREMPNVQQLDMIKRALQAQGRDVDNLGKATYDAVRANSLASDLRDAIGEAVPSYRKALELGGDKIAMDNALDFGRKLMSPSITREEVELATKGMNKAEKLNFKIGIRASLDERLANIKRTITDPNVDAREAMAAIKEFSSRAAQDKLENVLGKIQADAFLKKVDEVANAFALRSSVTQNSKTFVRDFTKGTVEGQVGVGPLSSLSRGQGLGAIQDVIQGVLGTTKADQRAAVQNVMADVVDILTTGTGPEAITKLQRLEASASSPATAEAIRKVISQLGVYASPGVGSAGSEMLGGPQP